MASENKKTQLLELGKLRRSARWPGYKCIGDYHDGAYESDFVSPYTKTAGNINADIMVILQDWWSDDGMSGPLNEDSAKLGYCRWVVTNQNLKQLLSDHFEVGLEQVYGTNLFPFIKLGKKNSSIKSSDMTRAAREFALPQIRIVNPRLVISIGIETFNALRKACELPTCDTTSDAIDSPFEIGSTRVWCQSHTGQLGRNNRNKGGVDRVSDDWKKMNRDFKKRGKEGRN